jgi:WD40 repeat protein
MAETLQLSLSPSPTDIPSALVFHPHTPTSLLVSSWDSTLRYYTISTNPSAQLISQYNHPAPILDCKFSADGRNAVTASVNGNVNWYVSLFLVKSLQARLLFYEERTILMVGSIWRLRKSMFWDLMIMESVQYSILQRQVFPSLRKSLQNHIPHNPAPKPMYKKTVS